MDDVLCIDGSHGEGGGQILRTALSLAAITGRPLRIENIRAERRRPGLAPQHLTAVRGAGALCAAQITGDTLGAMQLDFVPTRPVTAGHYAFDVAEAREGGSAGTTGLVLQTVLLPLAFAEGPSQVSVRGGTHLRWSPPFDYIDMVWLPMLGEIGIKAITELRAPGWYPIGEGEIVATIEGRGAGARGKLSPLNGLERPSLTRIRGRALTSNLPDHVAERMAGRALARLKPICAETEIDQVRSPAACAGAAFTLAAEYGAMRAGFSAVGERGKPAEAVADEAVEALLAHNWSGATLEEHLADQMLMPLAFASGPSVFNVERISRHLTTNAWVIEQFELARIDLQTGTDGIGTVRLVPRS